MNPAHVRAFDGILRRVGEDAVLRGEVVDPVRRVHITHDTELTGGYGEVVGRRTVATMWKSYTPVPGNTLVIDGSNWVIDSPAIEDNGVSVVVVLRKAA